MNPIAREIMRLRNVTFAELERRIGISKETIRHWEKGTYIPRADHLFKLEIAMNLEPGHFAKAWNKP